MTNKEKLDLLEKVLDIEEGTLNEGMYLADIAEWDSMAVILLIAMLDSKFGRAITSREIRGFTKVKNILDIMV
jgi:acyl carrier protein